MKKILLILALLGASKAFVYSQNPIVEMSGKMLLGFYTTEYQYAAVDNFTLCDKAISYTLFSLTKKVTMVNGKGAEIYSVYCSDAFSVKMDAPSNMPEPCIAIGDLSWNAQPREIVELSTATGTYTDATSAILKKEGISNPVVKVKKAFRVDMDGNGKNEVIVVSDNYPEILPSHAEAGHYAVIYLRNVKEDNTVENIFIEKEIYQKNQDPEAQPPQRFELLGILDVDHDGKFEIIVCASYYEGNSYIVYKFDGKKFNAVLATGCGA
ncbi:MAG: hypothetical protein V2A54_11340 [Bacteroidota bacterium]